jgi:hypothetical protein
MTRHDIIALAKKNGMTEFVPVGTNAQWVQIETFVTMAIEETRKEQNNHEHLKLHSQSLVTKTGA